MYISGLSVTQKINENPNLLELYGNIRTIIDLLISFHRHFDGCKKPQNITL